MPARHLLCAALSLGLPATVLAWGGEGAGTAAMPSVALNPAARPGGLAGAYAALGSGPSSIGLNPAGLATDSTMVYLGSVRPDLARTGAIAVSFPGAPGWGWFSDGQWAVSATYVDFDEILATDENGNAQGLVKPYNLYPAVSYARRVGDRVRAGATVKLAHETLGDFEGSTPAWGAGVDVGMQFQASRALTFGASVTNAGRQFSGYFEGDETRGSLPLAARVGAAWQPRGRRPLTLVAEAEAPLHAAPSLALGGEFAVRPEWVVRGGTRWSSEDVRNALGEIDPNAGIEEQGGEAVKIAGGTTVRIGPIAVDYAAQWWRELGIVHALTLSWTSPAATRP